jgi:hypothetical protein
MRENQKKTPKRHRPTETCCKHAFVQQPLSIKMPPSPLSSRVVGWACGPPMRMKMFRFSNLSLRTHHPFLFVIPSVPGFPTSPLSPTTTYVVLLKEKRMQLTEAATLDRKSGGAEGSAVRPSLSRKRRGYGSPFHVPLRFRSL